MSARIETADRKVTDGKISFIFRRVGLSAPYPRTAHRPRIETADTQSPILFQTFDFIDYSIYAAPVRTADRPRIAIPREAQPRSATETCLASAPTPFCFCSAPCHRASVVNLFQAAPCRLHGRGLAHHALRPASTSIRAAGRPQMKKRQCRTGPPKPPRGNIARWRGPVNARFSDSRDTDPSVPPCLRGESLSGCVLEAHALARQREPGIERWVRTR